MGAISPASNGMVGFRAHDPSLRGHGPPGFFAGMTRSFRSRNQSIVNHAPVYAFPDLKSPNLEIPP